MLLVSAKRPSLRAWLTRGAIAGVTIGVLAFVLGFVLGRTNGEYLEGVSLVLLALTMPWSFSNNSPFPRRLSFKEI